MNIYELPCPTCGSRIVSTARMMDDTKAPTNCEQGHTFMRSEAKKHALKSFYQRLRADLGQGPIQINACQRLRELHDELGTMRWLGADDGWDLAVDEVQKRAREMLDPEIDAAARLKAADGSEWTQDINGLGQGELVNAQQQVRAERIQEYVKRLKKMGIKQLGSGNFADVFQHPTMPNVVVKLLTENDHGYESYVKFAQQHKSNKYVPKIHEVVKADDAFDMHGPFDMSHLRLIFMEKLEPVHYNKYIDFGEHVTKLAGSEEKNVEKAMMNIETWRAVAKQTKDKDLQAFAQFIVKTVGMGAGVELDMHDGNVMQRGNQAIVTDPFSTYD